MKGENEGKRWFFRYYCKNCDHAWFAKRPIAQGVCHARPKAKYQPLADKRVAKAELVRKLNCPHHGHDLHECRGGEFAIAQITSIHLRRWSEEGGRDE